MLGLNSKQKIRFIKNIIIGENCWDWGLFKWKTGYGCFSLNYKNERAHRVSFRIFKGEIPKDKVICHHCDNPFCVKPSHLYAGTLSDNQNDVIKRGRKRMDGIFHPQHKLSKHQFFRIRDLYSSSRYSQKELSKKFNINPSSISRIVNGKRWVNFCQL